MIINYLAAIGVIAVLCIICWGAYKAFDFIIRCNNYGENIRYRRKEIDNLFKKDTERYLEIVNLDKKIRGLQSKIDKVEVKCNAYRT